MFNDISMFTPTMATVLERQGYFKEALQIYSHLLESVPGHKGYQGKVTEIRERLAGEAGRGERLPALFDEWLVLASRYRQLKQLKALRRGGAHAACGDRGEGV